MAIPLNGELEEIINRQFNSISNANLLFNKYVKGWGNNWSFEEKQKAKFLVNALKVKYDKSTFTKFLKRWQLLLNETNATQITGKVLWRLVVGLGSGSVLETSMTFHHILGVPYIPGSALKGVVSSYYLKTNGGEDETYIKLFGNQTQKGKVIFLDAYPTQFPGLELDIMNPHYQDYYGEKKDNTGELIPPADWLSPNPIKFLTVGKDTEFIFAFKSDDEELKEQTKVLIKEALQDLGIGAKTSVGYGFFKNFQDVAEPSNVNIFPAVEEKPQELSNYLKTKDQLKDEFINDDGTLKTEEEYKNHLISKGQEYTKKRRIQYQKAKKWYESRGLK
jgi:CRISPR-associated protein Cmr6